MWSRLRLTWQNKPAHFNPSGCCSAASWKLVPAEARSREYAPRAGGIAPGSKVLAPGPMGTLAWRALPCSAGTTSVKSLCWHLHRLTQILSPACGSQNGQINLSRTQLSLLSHSHHPPSGSGLPEERTDNDDQANICHLFPFPTKPRPRAGTLPSFLPLPPHNPASPGRLSLSAARPAPRRAARPPPPRGAAPLPPTATAPLQARACAVNGTEGAAPAWPAPPEAAPRTHGGAGASRGEWRRRRPGSPPPPRERAACAAGRVPAGLSQRHSGGAWVVPPVPAGRPVRGLSLAWPLPRQRA